MKTRWRMLCGVVVVGALCAPRAADARPFSIQVNDAIRRGIAALEERQNEDGTFGGRRFPEQHYRIGFTAFAVYALLHSGVPPEDPAIQKAVAWIRTQEVEKTYDAAAVILALHALCEDRDDELIRKAARWLVENVHPEEHVWAYPTGPTPVYTRTDLSNTQFAVLGLWIAERRGYKAPTALWTELATEVLRYQTSSGGFRYSTNRGGAYAATGMTTAGITILTLAEERIARARNGLARQIRAALERAWEYMDRTFRPDGNALGGHLYTTEHLEYALYGVERIATLSGRLRIAQMDWYRAGAHHLLGSQKEDGSWGKHLGDTCLALLFLRRATVTYVPGAPEASLENDEPATNEEPEATQAPTPPATGVPYVRDWLLLGPLAHAPSEPPDAKGPLRESAVRARENGRTAGLTWTAHRSSEDLVFLSQVLGWKSFSISYAFAWLHASEDTDAVVWVGADDAVRMYLDGDVVHDDPFVGAASKLGCPASLRLTKGKHRLLVRVENLGSGSGFYLRIVGPDGRALPTVRASLEER